MGDKKYHVPNKKLVTVWSVPNNCFRYRNVASMLELGEYRSYGDDEDATTKIVEHPTNKNEHDDRSNEPLQRNIMTHANSKKESNSSDGKVK